VRFIFWLSLIGIVYTYLGYPALLWIATRLRPRPWKTAQLSARMTPSVSIVLAVHNGLPLLERKIQHLLGLDYPNVQEVILVSDGSTDGTAEFLACQNHPRLRPVILPAHGGKAVAVNAGMAQATSDLIVFVDLRPEIAPGALQRLVDNFANDTVGCVAGEYILHRETPNHDTQSDGSASVGRLYWSYEQWIRKSEALIDSCVGVPGCFYAVRRALATPHPPGIILDDMFEPLSIIRQGYRCVLDSEAHVYDTWPKRVEGEFHRKVRTLAGNFQLFQLAPWVLSTQNRVLFQLFSHKIMRLIVPYLLVLLLVSAIALAPRSIFFTTVAAAQIFCWLLALVGSRFRIPVLHKIASPAATLLVLNAAAVVGFYKFLFTRGPLWKIWNSNRPADVSFPSATGT
jgi:cellulose synthase/poly-beta-1,6-N-acetylglucosamine synthase-like glycosyltransferase